MGLHPFIRGPDPTSPIAFTDCWLAPSAYRTSHGPRSIWHHPFDTLQCDSHSRISLCLWDHSKSFPFKPVMRYTWSPPLICTSIWWSPLYHWITVATHSGLAPICTADLCQCDIADLLRCDLTIWCRPLISPIWQLLCSGIWTSDKLWFWYSLVFFSERMFFYSLKTKFF